MKLQKRIHSDDLEHGIMIGMSLMARWVAQMKPKMSK